MDSSNNIRVASDYFVNVVHDIFDAYFSKLGAAVEATRDTHAVRYIAGTWFAEAIYLWTDGPRYCPRVEIGILPEPFADPSRNRVDICHTVPQTNPLFRYNLAWRYTNEDEAREAFRRIRDEIFQPYALPYIYDKEKLYSLLAARREELDRQGKEEINAHNASIARHNGDKAFHSGDYNSFLREIAVIPVERLSPAERKKVEYAQERLRRGR